MQLNYKVTNEDYANIGTYYYVPSPFIKSERKVTSGHKYASVMHRT